MVGNAIEIAVAFAVCTHSAVSLAQEKTEDYQH